MRTLVMAIALVLATSWSAGATQQLVPGYAGYRYAPPAPRWLAPRPSYLGGYLSAPAIISGAIAATAARAVAAPAVVVQRPDAIAEIRDAVTLQDVVDALGRLCAMADDPICAKLQPR